MNDHYLITEDRTALRLAFLSSYGLGFITLITFAFALIAIPISGANAPSDGGILYPYLETLEQFPRDYIWQYIAILMICIYLINIVTIRSIVKKEKQIYIQIASVFAMVSSVILLINYFVQVNVVPISLMNKEYEGIALITQYNPHGIFIAMEELGFTMMAISFGFLVPVFKGKYTRLISKIYLVALGAAAIGFVFVQTTYGLDKLDRYEVIIITITWIVLILNGIIIGNKVRKLWVITRDV